MANLIKRISQLSTMALLSGALLACQTQPASDTGLLQQLGTEQLVVVVSDNWDATTATLQMFNWQGGQWQAEAAPVAVNLGRAGLAWGIGLHPQQPGAYKVEGDGKATAGIFDLSTTFGYLPQADTAMPYQPMSASHYCMDVNGSPLYNQIVDEKIVGAEAVKGSTEPMRRDIHNNNQDIYKKGIVLDHNTANVSTKGSCIFLHLWFGPGVPTAGCTSMAEPNMDRLLAWLNPAKHPRYVALPAEQYAAKQAAWGLPARN